jgi:hypothetical protein
MRKFHLEFNDESAETLGVLARLKETTKTEVVRQSLNVYSYLDKRLRKGYKLYLESPEGEKITLVLP